MKTRTSEDVLEDVSRLYKAGRFIGIQDRWLDSFFVEFLRLGGDTSSFLGFLKEAKVL